MIYEKNKAFCNCGMRLMCLYSVAIPFHTPYYIKRLQNVKF